MAILIGKATLPVPMHAECLVIGADCPAPLLVGSQEHWLSFVVTPETDDSHLVGRRVSMTELHMGMTKRVSPDPSADWCII